MAPVLAILLSLGTPSQTTVVPSTSQVGALYLGGDTSRPKLNRSNCNDNSTRVSVVFNVFAVTNTAGGFGVAPSGVLYQQDVTIPPAYTGSASGGPQQYRAAVNCLDPTTDTFTLEVPLLSSTLTTFQASQYVAPVPTVSEFMSDLCNNADGGVRIRRAYCFGVRNGQGGAVLARGGDGPDIDTQAPNAPTVLSVQPGDTEAQLTVGIPPGTDSVEAANMKFVPQMRECSIPDAGAASSDAGEVDAGSSDGGTADAGEGPCGPFHDVGGAAASPVTVGNLVNGKSYELRAYAVDDFGNQGPPSSVSVFVAPRKEYGLLDLLGGGASGFSCADTNTAGGTPGLMVVGVVGAVLVWRRRKSRVNP
jgi:uncharacterized protein (TIGR03382 family)